MNILKDTIDAILLVIPVADENTVLRKALEAKRDGLIFTAPEAIAERWEEVALMLNVSVPVLMTQPGHFSHAVKSAWAAGRARQTEPKASPANPLLGPVAAPVEADTMNFGHRDLPEGGGA